MKLNTGQQQAEGVGAQLAGVVAEASLKLACLCNDLLQVYSNRNILCSDHACSCSSYIYWYCALESLAAVFVPRKLLLCFAGPPPPPLPDAVWYARLGVLPV